MAQGSVLWLAVDNRGRPKPVEIQSNGILNVTTNAINTKVFNGVISGSILALGRISNGQIIPIRLTELGAL